MNKEELIELIKSNPNDGDLGTTLRKWYWVEMGNYKLESPEEPYRPLPDGLYIGMSEIEGNGLFTSKHLECGKELGISHITNKSGDFDRDLIRTPLGGFINHNKDKANCEIYECGDYLKMRTIKEIRPSEELTLNYTLYKPCNYLKDDE